MSEIPKEVVQEIIKGNNFQNPGEVPAFLKEAFKDVHQEMPEAEMDAKLGYSRDEANKKYTDNMLEWLQSHRQCWRYHNHNFFITFR